MAELKLSSSDTVLLAPAGTASPVGWQVIVSGSTDWVGSIVLKQNTAPPGSTRTLVSVALQNPNTGEEIAAGTAITASGARIVSPTGGDLYVVYTHTSGTVNVRANPATQGVTDNELETAFLAAGFETSGQDTPVTQLSAAVAMLLGQSLDVRAFGAVGDGVTDDTEAIQAAIDAAQATVSATNGINVPVIYFPAGTYLLTSTVTKKSAPWVGAGVDDTMLLWDGLDSVDMVVQDALTARGGNSASGISGMSFYGAAGSGPRDMLVLGVNDAGYGVDYGYRLSNVRFRNCTRYALNLSGGFVNGHFEHLRFDSWGTYAINIITSSTMALNTFSLDQWTADHMAGSSAEGFLQVDNSVGQPNIGIVALENGRYENNAALTGNKAFINHISDLSDSCLFSLTNVTYQDVSDVTSGDVLVYHDGVAGSEQVTLTNFSSENLSAIFGGTFPADWPSAAPPAASYGYFYANRQAIIAEPRTGSGTPRGLVVYTRDTGGSAGVSVYRGAEANPRILMGSDGVLLIGDGTVAPSTVVRGRRTGWTAATGTATRTTFDTTTVTTELLAQRVKALLDDLITHGLIGA